MTGAAVFVAVLVVCVLRWVNREGHVRFCQDMEDGGWWYSTGEHTEPTPKEWR